MAWDPGIEDEIGELFGEHIGTDRYERALEARGAWMRSRMVEYVAEWRKRNPEKFKVQRRRWVKRWEAKNPDKVRVAKQRYRDKHRDQVRAWNRKNQQARRARLRAARA